MATGGNSCFKCQSPLIEGAPEQGPSTSGGSARGMNGYKTPSYGRITFTPFFCPRCRRTRAVKAGA